MPDYRANLVARAFMTEAEREVYVRHNVRTLRGEYPAPLLWRMLVRYLFEYQYLGRALGFTRVEDPRSFFLSCTWFADDFLSTGVLESAGSTRSRTGSRASAPATRWTRHGCASQLGGTTPDDTLAPAG